MQIIIPGPGPREHFDRLIAAVVEGDRLLERVATKELASAGLRIEVRPDRRRAGFTEGADPVDSVPTKSEPPPAATPARARKSPFA